MDTLDSVKQEAAEDVFFGQLVIIWARWFLILAGILITFWTVNSETELSLSMLPIIALMIMNFFLHGRYMMERPANRLLIMITSTLDLVIVTLIVAFWPGAAGLRNHYFILYYPAILGFSFVFSHKFAIVYTAVAVVAYGVVCYVIEPSLFGQSFWMELLVQRLVTLAATGALGSYYWRIQRNRRRMEESKPAPA